MSKILIKPGVLFTVIRPAGQRILEVLKQIVAVEGFDITITSACDGAHSGPNDPHKTGEAYDIRTHDLSEVWKALLLKDIQTRLGLRFYTFLEAPGTGNEHIHCQRKGGTIYTIEDYFNNS